MDLGHLHILCTKKKKQTTVHINQQVSHNRKGVEKNKLWSTTHPVTKAAIRNQVLDFQNVWGLTAHKVTQGPTDEQSWLESRAGWLVPTLGKAASRREWKWKPPGSQRSQAPLWEPAHTVESYGKDLSLKTSRSLFQLLPLSLFRT